MADECDDKSRRPAGNFLTRYRDPETRSFRRVTAQDFLECWQHYDKDNSGYLEGEELDDFLREFVVSIVQGDAQGREVISATALDELKVEMMQAYDENEDGRISISELAQMLPTDETFLCLFGRENPVSSSVEFIRVWQRYDSNNDGYIGSDRLSEFLSALLTQSGITVTDDKLAEYTSAILKLFDADGDGRLQLSEMSRLMPVKENYLRKPLFKNAARLTLREINRIFRKYDTDGNGSLENEELQGFCKDLVEAIGEDADETTLGNAMRAILGEKTEGGSVGQEELTAILLQTSRMAQEREALQKAMEDA